MQPLVPIAVPKERSVAVVFTRCPSGHYPLFRVEKDRVPELFERSHCNPCCSDFEIKELALGVVPESIARLGYASVEPQKIVSAQRLLF